ncbi:MAG: hypothetical protein ACOC9S_07090 [Planctomycetota bacterium]
MMGETIMGKTLCILLALAVVTCGCLKVEVPSEAVRIGGGRQKSVEDDGRTIPTQLPAAGSSGSWADVAARMAGQLFLSAEKGVIFYAYDTLAYPDEPVDLVADVVSARSLKGVKEVTVEFRDTDGERIARTDTDKDGRAVAEWTPPQAGNYPLTAEIVAVDDDDDEELLELSPAPLVVSARQKDAKLAIIDLDHTVVGSSFFRVLTVGATPMADSARVTKRIADRYSIVYLTHRPDLMTRKSKQWLIDNGYPAGPLLVSRMNEALGSSGAYKTERLKAVREAFPNTGIGIGDKISDAQAYLDNGLTAYLIPNYDDDDPDELRETAEGIRKPKPKDRLQVVSNWRQIEAGIFDGEEFPAEAFARSLKRRAENIEREQQRREDEDDDDDDDDDDDEDDDEDDGDGWGGWI